MPALNLKITKMKSIINPDIPSKIGSLFEGNPINLCSLCGQLDCTCQTIIRKKPDEAQLIAKYKNNKYQRALRKLRAIFKEDQPICRFS